MDKVVELAGGGSVINGAYPVRPFKNDFFCAVRIYLDKILRRVMHENYYENL